MKTELTRESILKAVNDGLKSISAIAISHGYNKPISGGVAKKIRSIVPEIAELLASKTAKKAPVKTTKSVKKAPAKAVKKVKKVKKTSATAEKAPEVIKVEQTEQAPEVVKAEQAPEVIKAEQSEQTEQAPEVVKAEQAPEVVKAEKAVRRKKSYGGKIYGRIFAEASVAGEVDFWPFVQETAVKLGLTNSQVSVALNVMRIPNHQSNGKRSMDISEKRGFMNLVPFVEKAEVSEVSEVSEVVTAEVVTAEISETIHTVEAVHGEAI